MTNAAKPKGVFGLPPEMAAELESFRAADEQALKADVLAMYGVKRREETVQPNRRERRRLARLNRGKGRS